MKFYDAIGYGESVERPEGSGIFEDIITERKLYGDVIRNTRALEEADKVNNDRSVGARFSVTADAYANQNYMSIIYVKWSGQRFLVTNVDATQPPRLIITPGGVYHGPTPEAPGSIEDTGD